MTDYATAPVTGEVYDHGVEGVIDDAWMGVDHQIPPDLTARFGAARRLTMGPSAVLLAWEQGGNAPQMVFALRSDPCRDLAAEQGFGLHRLADNPDDPDLPECLRSWYRPVADLIARLAVDENRSILRRGAEVMQRFFAEVAEHGILRGQELDEDGTLVGLDRDVAADLPAAWAARVAEEMS